MELDHRVVVTADGVRHARVPGAPILLCGRDVPHDAKEFARGDVDCPDCLAEADGRGGDRAVGAVEA